MAKPDEVQRKPSSPIVIVSSRARGLHVSAERYGAKGRAEHKPGLDLHIDMGITFLCAEVSLWAFLDRSPNSPPPTSMPSNDLHVLQLRATGEGSSALASKVRGMVNADKRAAIVAEIERLHLESLAEAGNGKPLDPESPTSRLFHPDDISMRPEVVVIEVAKIFHYQDQAAEYARTILRDAIPIAKDPNALGALHDFAVMASARGSDIVTMCRARLSSMSRKA